MKGYGFSVWLLPILMDQRALISLIRKKISITHRPHITIDTNFESLEDAKKVANNYKGFFEFTVNGKLHKSEKQYSHDPLSAWVFPASIHLIPVANSHLTAEYFLSENFHETPDMFINYEGAGSVVVADTRDEPENWYIVG